MQPFNVGCSRRDCAGERAASHRARQGNAFLGLCIMGIERTSEFGPTPKIIRGRSLECGGEHGGVLGKNIWQKHLACLLDALLDVLLVVPCLCALIRFDCSSCFELITSLVLVDDSLVFHCFH